MSPLTNQLTETPSSWSCVVIFVRRFAHRLIEPVAFISSMKSTDLRMRQLTNQLTETPSSWSCAVIFVVLQYFGSCSAVGLPGHLVFHRGHHWSLMSLLWTSAWAAPFASQESSTRGENSEGQQAFHRPCLMCLRQALV